MSRSIYIALDLPAEHLVWMASDYALRKGFSFDGDEESGSFSGGGFSGEYFIYGNEMTLTVTRKPFFIPWGLVEFEVRKFFSAAAVAD